jgi:GNAT superfamily N-acetyltransferase
MLPITIRPVEPTDIADIAAIRAQRPLAEPFWADRIARYFRGEHSPQQALSVRAGFVAMNCAELVGFVAGHLTQRFGCQGELQWIDVVEHARKQGIGYQLIARIGDWFVEQSPTRVCVNVDPNNTPACRLYANCGPQPFNEYWMIWHDARVMAANCRLN